jgi:iron complex outermembrane receptor protein
MCGIRLYADGIPLMRRGPFSSLYGNSSGGVIQLFTEDAPKAAEVGCTVMYSSNNTKR